MPAKACPWLCNQRHQFAVTDVYQRSLLPLRHSTSSSLFLIRIDSAELMASFSNAYFLSHRMSRDQVRFSFYSLFFFSAWLAHDPWVQVSSTSSSAASSAPKRKPAASADVSVKQLAPSSKRPRLEDGETPTDLANKREAQKDVNDGISQTPSTSEHPQRPRPRVQRKTFRRLPHHHKLLSPWVQFRGSMSFP